MINRLFYIRHGLTDALEKGVLCGGDSDLDLNHKGREGVRILSRLLAPLLSNIDHIYSSPLKRAVQTAEIIGKAANKEVKIIEELREWRLGEWEGVAWEKLPFLFTNENDPADGEPRAKFRERTVSSFQKIIASSPRCMVVGHAVFFYELSKHMAGVGRILEHSEVAIFTTENAKALNFDVIQLTTQDH